MVQLAFVTPLPPAERCRRQVFKTRGNVSKEKRPEGPPAFPPCTVIGSSACTARAFYPTPSKSPALSPVFKIPAWGSGGRRAPPGGLSQPQAHGDALDMHHPKRRVRWIF